MSDRIGLLEEIFFRHPDFDTGKYRSKEQEYYKTYVTPHIELHREYYNTTPVDTTEYQRLVQRAYNAMPDWAEYEKLCCAWIKQCLKKEIK